MFFGKETGYNNSKYRILAILKDNRRQDRDKNIRGRCRNLRWRGPETGNGYRGDGDEKDDAAADRGGCPSGRGRLRIRGLFRGRRTGAADGGEHCVEYALLRRKFLGPAGLGAYAGDDHGRYYAADGSRAGNDRPGGLARCWSTTSFRI